MLPIIALTGTAWLGIALDEPYSAVFARMGDPVMATSDRDGGTKFVYLADHENAFLTVLTENGRVSGLRLWALPTANPKTPDPYGIALNEDAARVLQARGKPSRTAADADGPFDAYQDGDVLWMYHLNGNQTVKTITLATTQAAVDDLAKQPLPQLHTGASPADAIVMDVSSDEDARRWEKMFLAVRPCEGNGTRHIDKRDTQTAGNTAYDVVRVSCSSGGAPEVVYFTKTR